MCLILDLLLHICMVYLDSSLNKTRMPLSSLFPFVHVHSSIWYPLKSLFTSSPGGMLCVSASIGWCTTKNNILSKSMPIVFAQSAFFFPFLCCSIWLCTLPKSCLNSCACPCSKSTTHAVRTHAHALFFWVTLLACVYLLKLNNAKAHSNVV